jgi:hypothetical protein
LHASVFHPISFLLDPNLSFHALSTSFAARAGQPNTFPFKMPLWRIYSHEDTFNEEQKVGLSKSITSFYSPGPDVGMPEFYVNVVFVPLPNNHIFIGGKPNNNFVRITVEHIARRQPDPDTEGALAIRRRMMDRLHTVRAPW